MEFLPGGDLYSLLEKQGSLSESHARIYAAQIIAALESLRAHDIIHHDLKPDNILVGADGRLKLTDFGLSFLGVVDRGLKDDPIVTSDSIVGTPDYLAPEIVLSKPHTFTADYWSLGIIIYEFLVGVPPFHGENEGITFANIVRGEFSFEDCEVSEDARDLISKLLTLDPEERLGVNGIHEIQQHSWFSGIDWMGVANLTPPFVPDITDATSTAYFQERYHFVEHVEDDIREDIRDYKQARSRRSRSRRGSGEMPESISESKLIDEFESVAVRRLSEFNYAVAQTMRHRRSSSLAPISGDLLSDR
jgi:serine/threonine protein kinase